jgi:VWFA-related protein
MVRGKWQFAVAWLALFLAAGVCMAQETGASAQKQTPPIHVVTRLVNVSVVVQDKKGNPVTGLTVKDFTLDDGGRRQTIAFFHPPAGAVPTEKPAPLDPDVYSNLPGLASGTPDVTMILLDGLNTPLLDQDRVRKQVLRYLKQIQPGDHVALYALTTHLIVIHDFTASTASLLAALDQYEKPGSASVTRQGPTIHQIENQVPNSIMQGQIQTLNQSIQQASEVTAAYARNNRLGLTLAALQTIARHAAGIPGRKNLIWLAGQLPYCLCREDMGSDTFESQQLGQAISEMEQLFAAANVAIYPVDARGLFGPGLAVVPTDAGPPTTMPGVSPHFTFAAEEAAKATGGRAFFNTNDIFSSIRRAVGDSKASYLLSYYPDHDDWKGEFRKIKVMVDRPDVNLRARSGYFAIPEIQRDPQAIGIALRQISLSPLDSTGIHFAARVTPIRTMTASRVEITLRFDPHALSFVSENNLENAEMLWAFFQLNSRGQILSTHANSEKISVSRAAYEKGMKEGMGFSSAFPLDAQATDLRIVLMDRSTGAAGSLTIPLAKYHQVPSP